jgi:hypothetical protein
LNSTHVSPIISLKQFNQTKLKKNSFIQMNPYITHGVTKEWVTHPKSHNIEAIVTMIKNKSIIESNKMKGIQLLTQCKASSTTR